LDQEWVGDGLGFKRGYRVTTRVTLDDFNTIPAKLNGSITQGKKGSRFKLIHPDDVAVQDTHWLVKHFLPVGITSAAYGRRRNRQGHLHLHA
jgi:hypothetical protein